MSRPFIPVANTASVELIYQNGSEFNENVFHVQKGSPFSASDLTALRTVVDNWDNATGRGTRFSGAQLVRIRCKALDSLGSPMEEYLLPSPRNGTGGGSVLPLNVAFCVKLSTGLTGRSQRGRWYWGNLSSGILIDAGHIAVANQTGYANVLNTLLANLATAGYTMVVTSYMTGGAWRSAGQNTPVVTCLAIDNALDSQRRRLPGRGHTV